MTHLAAGIMPEQLTVDSDRTIGDGHWCCRCLTVGRERRTTEERRLTTGPAPPRPLELFLLTKERKSPLPVFYTCDITRYCRSTGYSEPVTGRPDSS
ncbi:unnamed protein product [Sphagnum jensenii]|uniref:Uncharacterized protein n=1 Tax=Sphagnum jensenii TaxID=128206 RepID=A0ABP1BXK6_9BRYO